jgi:hypothetical protein
MDGASAAAGAAELVPDGAEPAEAPPEDEEPDDQEPAGAPPDDDEPDDDEPVGLSPEDDAELEAAVAAVVSPAGRAAVSAG